MQLRDVEKKLVQAGRQMAAKEREFKYSREVDRRQIGPLRSKLKAMERNEARAEELGKELDLILGPVTTVDLTTTIPAEPAGPLAHSDSALPSEPCSGSVEDPITIADNPQNPQGKRTLPSELCCGPNTMTEIPPTSETEPTLPFEHSSGRVEDPTTVTGRKIAKPVSRLNKVRPRTTRDEVNLLEEYFNRATADRSKPPTKEMLWDIVSQMSKVTDAAESESLEDLEKAMAVVTSIAYDSAAGKNTIPEFLADMAVALSDELGEILQKRLLEVKPQEEEDDEDDEDDEEDEEDSDEENSDEENSDEESEEE